MYKSFTVVFFLFAATYFRKKINMDYENQMMTIFESAREHVWVKDVVPVLNIHICQHHLKTMIVFFQIEVDHTCDDYAWKEYHKQNPLIKVWLMRESISQCSFDIGYKPINLRSFSGSDIQDCLADILNHFRE